MEKLEWCGYPTVKNLENMFIRFNRVHEQVRPTDGRTNRHRATAYVALMHSIAQQNDACDWITQMTGKRCDGEW